MFEKAGLHCLWGDRRAPGTRQPNFGKPTYLSSQACHAFLSSLSHSHTHLLSLSPLPPHHRRTWGRGFCGGGVLPLGWRGLPALPRQQANTLGDLFSNLSCRFGKRGAEAFSTRNREAGGQGLSVSHSLFFSVHSVSFCLSIHSFIMGIFGRHDIRSMAVWLPSLYLAGSFRKDRLGFNFFPSSLPRGGQGLPQADTPTFSFHAHAWEAGWLPETGSIWGA